MPTSIEVETKIELDERDFERVRRAGTVRKCVEQLNVYYDQDWKLAKRAATFRIRMLEGEPPIVTLKVPVRRHRGRREAKEVELGLRTIEEQLSLWSSRRTIDVRSHLPANFRKEMVRLGIRVLSRVGWIRNRRYVVEFDPVGSLELDRIELPDGTVAFEAEIESPDLAVHQRLSELIHQLAPSARAAHVSKFERFVVALRRLAALEQSAASVAGGDRSDG